ncbi:MAG: hypothetical protein ABFD69_16580 [Candidatus Sumerlaeia bacterium]
MTRVRIYQAPSRLRWAALEAFRRIARELGEDAGEVVSCGISYQSLDNGARDKDRAKDPGDDFHEKIGRVGRPQA